MARTDDPVRQKQVEESHAANGGTAAGGAAAEGVAGGRSAGVNVARKAPISAEPAGTPCDGLAVGSLFRP